jgi:hypothetical protein
MFITLKFFPPIFKTVVFVFIKYLFYKSWLNAYCHRMLLIHKKSDKKYNELWYVYL